MDPVETGVIIIVSVIIGGLVVGLIYDWEYQETYQDIKEKFDVIPYQKEIEKTTLNGLVNEVSEFQDFAIKSNKNVNKSFHITDNKNSSKNEFFEIIKGVHFCSTISSEENDCGKGEVFEFFSPIEGPTIVNLEYKDGDSYASEDKVRGSFKLC